MPETVIRNLYRFHESGGALDPERLLGASRLSAATRARVFDIFRQLGIERLAPAYQALSGDVPYQEFHLLRLYLSCRDGK